MIRYTRGSRVVIETIFYDTSGDITYPTSVNLTIAYPDGSTAVSAWPVSGDELQTTSGISMSLLSTVSTADNVGVWASTWNSGVAGTGIVYWTAVPTTEALVSGVKEGRFELRGGLANPTAVPTTL